MTRQKLIIASNNPRKVAEIEAMLGPLPIQVEHQPSHLDVEETGASYLENGLLKAQAAAEITNSWTIADDSGLEVDALNGEPGLFSARYAKTNAEKLEKILQALEGNPYRSARFCSVMVLCDPKGNLLKEAEGICWGEILNKPAYPGGEFESLFWVREANAVYGRLSQEQLTRLGSRGKAARTLAPYLLKAFNLD